MEECSEVQEEKKHDDEVAGMDQDMEDETERGRPSTPKWWRPPIPPETYKWEEVRRQRQKGGYPWTHLDKDEEIDVDDYLDDNLYEPVNPPPLYGNDSYLSKDLQQVPQMEDKMIEIPPEIEILTSEGLDGLDKPDPHDMGFDGDREWQNASEDEGRQSRSSFPGGLRSKGESRSTTPKSVGFSPEAITHEVPADEYPEDREAEEGEGEVEPVASSSSRGRRSRSRSNSPGRKQTAFDILRSKAAVAADHMRERLRAAIPVRPKMPKSSGRKRRKVKHEQEATGEQEVPEETEMGEATVESVEQVEKVEDPGEEGKEEIEVEASLKEDEVVEGEEEKKSEDEPAEEKSAKQLQKEEKERKKAEEKLAKQKAAEEAKQAKIEEKLAKAREAEEKRQAKAEEEKRKQEEKEEAARKAAEAKKAEEERKAAEKAAKEEEARKIAEAKKAEEEARKAAEKAKKEEEARKKAEAKKAEEERKAAEKAKKEEEARLAAEAKKAEDERKAAEKAAKEEEARLAAEAKKAAEEEAKKAAEAKKAEEDAIKKVAAEEAAANKSAVEEEAVAEKMEEVLQGTSEQAEDQPMEATENAEGGEAPEEEQETPQPQTPCGTTKRKYIKHRKNAPIVLSQLPNPIATLRNQVEDFKNKLKRSRTPPRRQVQRKHRRSRSADASRSPPRDPDEVSKAEDEAEQEGSMATAEAETSAVTHPPDEEVKQVDDQIQAEMETTSVQSASKTDEEVQKSEEASQEVEQEPAPEEPVSNTGTTGRRRKQQPAKEKLDKLGAQLKGLGAKSIGIAAQAGKEVGQVFKVVGKDLKNLGAKAVGELKPKSDPSKVKAESQEELELGEEAAPTPSEPEVAPPKRSFKFKRRGESAEEEDEELESQHDQEHFYENAQDLNRHDTDRDPFAENALGARDWESPHDRANSRGVSEERVSGNASYRDSPPGSSLASSTMAQVRRTGVLEEIDSDEFFLRERGISEGEDEEEVNRFLVEELRQAFRPSLSNALAGFDMESPVVPPSRPERAPRKPPRKDKENIPTPSTYQTFPPERPKRKQPQGYVSKFMKEHEGEDGEYLDSNEEVRGSACDMEDMEELEETDTLQRVKEKLSELDQDLNMDPGMVEVEEEMITATVVDEYVDDGRYEPISDHPTKPSRNKRKPQRPATPPSFYYNTIAGNEWLRELEEQVHGEPAAPVRKRRGSGKSNSLPPASDDGYVPQHDQLIPHGEPSQAPSEMSGSVAPSVPESINGDYVDEAGYAIVQKDKDLPKTIPRKKKKRTNLSEQQSGSTTQDNSFFSLPRPGPRQDEMPPTRPQRNYSTLRPRRPPRSKSGSRQNLESKSPVPSTKESDEPRPSTAIGIMQGRPLPPPPRPQRSPAPPLSDVDQSSFEMSVGLRHYANFEDIESRPLEEVLPPRVIEVDIACQTDPVPDDEFIVGLTEEDSGRIRTASSRLEGQETRDTTSVPSTTTAGDVSSCTLQAPPPQPTQPPPPSNTQSANPPNPAPNTFSFPTRLHLEQLEVDFLRVNDLCAHSIKVENLQASQLEVNSISSSGPVCVARIDTQTLNSDEVSCGRLSSDRVDIPSVPPSSFYHFSDQAIPGSEHELCVKAEEQEDKENDSACPQDLSDSVNNLMMMGNVDSTNHFKPSHVAEKIVDKQLNLPDSTKTEDFSKAERRDVSVGSNIPSTVSPQLNNLNQTAQIHEDPTNETLDVPTQQNVSNPPSLPPRAITPEPDEEETEDNVVCGSYTLPYSYMTPQPPSPPVRQSSLKKSHRTAEPAPKSPPAPRRDSSHIAFGHTSVAQGEVLSVKLSIPVERGPIGQTVPPPQAMSQPSAVMRTPPASPRPNRATTSNHLPDSARKQAESKRKDSQPVDKPVTPPATPPASSTPNPTLSRRDDSSSDTEENFFTTSVRIGRAVLRLGMRALQTMADYIDTAASEDPTKAEQQRANMQVLLCLLLILLVGLLLATTRTGAYTSPRWEFLMPPPDL